MARQQKSERAVGPYPARGRWRVALVEGGTRVYRYFPTREEAEAFLKEANREFRRSGDKSVEEGIEAYERYLLTEKGNKPGSVEDTLFRLRTFFPDTDLPLADLTPHKCSGYYEGLRTKISPRTKKAYSVDTQRNVLAEAKTFLRWCAERRFVGRSVLDQVKGVGKRRHGKPQLRIDEARRWLKVAGDLAERGEGWAVAAMLALVLGMRASEILSRVVRDLDDEGRLLWIPDSKTEAGRRTLEVPDFLRPYLQHLAQGKGKDELIFGAHWRDYLRKAVAKICRLAGVPKVSAHSMRGLHSTLALAHGTSGHVVAASLGHKSEATTLRSYADPTAVESARRLRTLSVLEGRKVAS
jgi:integrase